MSIKEVKKLKEKTNKLRNKINRKVCTKIPCKYCIGNKYKKAYNACPCETLWISVLPELQEIYEWSKT